MANKFKIGDLVRLKSGGPIMTINTHSFETSLRQCVWFGEDDQIHSHDFHPDALNSEEDPEEA